mmetsp:Transcript_51535/g.116141  ORF Transcript_51535/g.116141 Transcript_51535/m.116141 type:complete len:221 (-) Transcript_51535:455-1117(-)
MLSAAAPASLIRKSSAALALLGLLTVVQIEAQVIASPCWPSPSVPCIEEPMSLLAMDGNASTHISFQKASKSTLLMATPQDWHTAAPQHAMSGPAVGSNQGNKATILASTQTVEASKSRPDTILAPPLSRAFLPNSALPRSPVLEPRSFGRGPEVQRNALNMGLLACLLPLLFARILKATMSPGSQPVPSTALETNTSLLCDPSATVSDSTTAESPAWLT